MIVRIVKMTFLPETVFEFLNLFEERKELIRNRKGCHHLELLQEKKEGCVFFTYSYWETEEDLERYRKSELFKDTWEKTKALFEKKAEAWSLNQLHELK